MSTIIVLSDYANSIRNESVDEEVGSDLPADVSVLHYLIMTFIGVNMVGIGGQLNSDDMLRQLQRPIAVTAGLFTRYCVVPAVALGLSQLLKSTHVPALGMLAYSCSPPSGVNNIMVLMAEADFSLSVTMTLINIFSSSAIFPLWTILFEQQLYSDPGQVEIPFRHTFLVFGYIVITLLIGYILQNKYTQTYDTFWIYLPIFTIITVVFIFCVILYNNFASFLLLSTLDLLIAIVLVVSGYLVGLLLSLVLRQSQKCVIAIVMETGVHSTYFVELFISRSLPETERAKAKTVAILACVLSLLSSSVFVCVYRWFTRSRDSKIECSKFEETEAANESRDETDEITKEEWAEENSEEATVSTRLVEV